MGRPRTKTYRGWIHLNGKEQQLIWPYKIREIFKTNTILKYMLTFTTINLNNKLQIGLLILNKYLTTAASTNPQ